MKLKVQFIRSPGWSPEICLLSPSDPRLGLETSANQQPLLHPRFRGCVTALRMTAIPTAVPGCPGNSSARVRVLPFLRMRELQLIKSNQIKTTYMKNQQSITAPRNAAGITNKGMLVVAACLLGLATLAGGQPAPDKAAPDSPPAAARSNAAPPADTNSPVASIAADLARLKARIEAATAAMSNSVASSPALQAAKVTKLADEITELGTKDLGEEGQILKQAQALTVKFNESVAKARQGASDPNVGPSVREIYGQLLPGLERELAQLIDAKSTAARIRSELLRQAEGLRQSAEAIGFAEHCNQLVLASQAYRAALAEVTKFTEKIALLIQSVGRGVVVPIT